MPSEIINTNPEMGARGRARREAIGMSIETLAGALRVGKTRIRQMEQQGVDRVSSAEAWASALQVDPTYLIFGRPKKKASK